MQYQMVDPRLIRPNPWNTNVVSHENELKLRASIERNGLFKPSVVREVSGGALESVGGWHRVEQSIELGLREIPIINLGPISDEKAKEISLADNARYGIDDTLLLRDLIASLDVSEVENFMPWTQGDLIAMTASLSIDVDSLDLDEIVLPDDDEPPEEIQTKAPKTHQMLRFRCSIIDAARVAARINSIKLAEGFTTEDDLTNAGDALAYLVSGSANDEDDTDAAV